MTTEDIKQIIDRCFKSLIPKNITSINICAESDRIEIDIQLHDNDYYAIKGRDDRDEKIGTQYQYD